MMLALEAGAEDFTSEEEVYEITTEPSDFTTVRDYIFLWICLKLVSNYFLNILHN